MVKRKAATFEDYVKNAFQFKFVPKDQFSHAYFLLTTEPKDVEEFFELINKHALLGNIDSDRLMRFYQNDIYFLTNLFELQRREPALRNLFKVLYTSWIFEIALTRTKKGLERQLQAFGQQIVKPVEGYGGLLEKLRRKKEEEQPEFVIYE